MNAVGVAIYSRVLNERYQALFRQADTERKGSLDFPAFLWLMRWLIDEDFGGVKTRLQLESSGSPKAGKRDRRAFPVAD